MTSTPSRPNGAVLLLGVGIGCFAAGLLAGVLTARLAATNSAAPESVPVTTARANADAGSVLDRAEPAPPAKSQSSPRSGGYGRKAPPPPASSESAESVTAPADPPKPPAPSDRDGDGVPDDKDGCPDNKSLTAPRAFYLDSDDDGAGDPAKPSAEKSCDSTPPKGYVDNKNDECPVDKLRTKQLEFFLDSDGDGAGDPKTKKDSCDSTPPKGYVDNKDDECPNNKDKKQKGTCGCDWTYPDRQDLNADGIADCEQDDDHDGVRNADDKDYLPASPAEKQLERIGVAVADFAARITALDANRLTVEAYTSRLATELKELKKLEGEIVRLEKQLHAEAEQGKRADKPHGFDRTMFPGACGCKVSRDPQLIQAWRRILEGLKRVGVGIESSRDEHLRQAIIAASTAPTGGGAKDRSPERLQRLVNDAYGAAMRSGPAKLLDVAAIDRELRDLDRDSKGGKP